MVVPGLIAKKIGMTRVVDDTGKYIPVTLVEVAKQKITKILTPERDGYHALQVGFYEKKESRLNKPDIYRLRKVNVDDNFARFKELRFDQAPQIELGVVLDIDSLGEFKALDVTGITKGRGFQGAIKRWGHSIGRMSHGSDFRRRPGSLGCRTTPGRVFKNKHQPGHMGVVRRTIQNLLVVDVNKDANVIAIKGSIPGHIDSYILLRPTNK